MMNHKKASLSHDIPGCSQLVDRNDYLKDLVESGESIGNENANVKRSQK